MLDHVLHLSLINGIGPATINAILQTVHDAATLYTFREADFIEHCKLQPSVAAVLVQGLAHKKVLERELALAQSHGIKIISIHDEEYPPLLKEVYLPPYVIYVKGTLPSIAKAVAVVGSRKANTYAHAALEALLPVLIENKWVIVSGGAYGADTFAHSITMQQGGTTYAVLGSGLLKPYPPENADLFEQIVETGGAVISSFGLEHLPLPGNFPARNRIIAGLSQGCLVVQAAQKSGALITARYALEQGKDVFVVPGPITDSLNNGGHQLIQQGAKLVATAQDILSEFNETAQLSIIEKKSTAQAQEQDPILILCSKPISFEELLIGSELSYDELQTKLFNWQLEGKIAQNFAGLWEVS